MPFAHTKFRQDRFADCLNVGMRRSGEEKKLTGATKAGESLRRDPGSGKAME